MTILLKQVIDAIEMACDSYTEFYDRKTGKTVSLPDPMWTGETDGELEALLESESDRFLRFPTKFEIHEFRMTINILLLEEYCTYGIITAKAVIIPIYRHFSPRLRREPKNMATLYHSAYASWYNNCKGTITGSW